MSRDLSAIELFRPEDETNSRVSKELLIKDVSMIEHQQDELPAQQSRDSPDASQILQLQKALLSNNQPIRRES